MYVLGTAGHVDHGKSTLVRALTGINPDRLKEEQERQMTIDLGFAWFNLPSIGMIGIVDVPGHRDFIENMVAGVGGIDAVLLVVAADEGVMPQTREHLNILQLLGVERGLVVLTKCDLVDDEWHDLIILDLHEHLMPTSLHNAPLNPVSVHTGYGLDSLQHAILQLLENTPERVANRQPRLPIDRVFTLTGYGTVATGTLIDGSLSVGDEVQAYPTSRRARIRGLQSYKQPLQQAQPGTRVAVNLSNIEHHEIKRGQVLGFPHVFTPTTRIDVKLTMLNDLPFLFNNNAQVKLFAGASEAMVRVRLLESDDVEPGQTTWAQLILDEPLTILKDDRFIVRWPSPPLTIGGGIVLDIAPARRWKRFRSEVIDKLKRLEEETSEEHLLRILNAEGAINDAELSARSGLNLANVRELISELIGRAQVVALPGEWFVSASRWKSWHDQACTILEGFHTREPLKAGMPREELRRQLKLSPALFQHLLTESMLITEGVRIRLPEHSIRLDSAQQLQAHALLGAMLANRYTPPTYQEALQIAPQMILQALIDRGDLVQIKEEIILHHEAYRTMVDTTLHHINEYGQIDVRTLRDHFATSRKYAIALLEHLDQLKLTQRQGDVRIKGPNTWS